MVVMLMLRLLLLKIFSKKKLIFHQFSLKVNVLIFALLSVIITAQGAAAAESQTTLANVLSRVEAPIL
jgi:hypothetical protein